MIRNLPKRFFPEPLEFEWDEGNAGKNRKHDVEDMECEEVFFDERKVALRDTLHSDKEERFILLGKTKTGRLLYLVFTTHGHKLRVISARDINRKEIFLYEEKT